MHKNEQPFKPWAGYYKIEYLDEEPKIVEQELFDTVFAKFEKIQRQAMFEKIQKAEALLANLEDELDMFLAKRWNSQ